MAQDPQKPSRRLRLLVVCGCIYVFLWALTAFVGGPEVRRFARDRMKVSQSSTDISSHTRAGSGPVVSDTAVPYHWCVVRAYAPFFVSAHSGEVRGGLDGSGT